MYIDYYNNVVQQNAQKTWCFYPTASDAATGVSCAGDFAMVSQVHLNTTTSIGYYAPDNSRLGGAEWAIPAANAGRVTLCVSGRGEDGTYLTACMFVTQDNSLPMSSGCEIAIAQENVTDGCYVPGQTPYVTSSFLVTDTTYVHAPTGTVTYTATSSPNASSHCFGELGSALSSIAIALATFIMFNVKIADLYPFTTMYDNAVEVT